MADRSLLKPDRGSCHGCGAQLPPSKNPGNPRKWCSERCRKASYGDPCVDCGARTCYGAETARVAEPRCNDCRQANAAERRVTHVLEMARLRIEGVEPRDIAKRLNIPKSTVAAELTRLRTIGFDVPRSEYRNAADARWPSASCYFGREVETLRRALVERGIHPPHLASLEKAA